MTVTIEVTGPQRAIAHFSHAGYNDDRLLDLRHSVTQIQEYITMCSIDLLRRWGARGRVRSTERWKW